MNKYGDNLKRSRKNIELFRSFKKSKNFICDECDRDFSENLKLLHVHHIDENPYNNEILNLRVLCMGCHMRLHLKGRHPKFWKGKKGKDTAFFGRIHTAESKAKISKGVRMAYAINKIFEEFDL